MTERTGMVIEFPVGKITVTKNGLGNWTAVFEDECASPFIQFTVHSKIEETAIRNLISDLFQHPVWGPYYSPMIINCIIRGTHGYDMLPVAQAPKWLPMATAPKDGTIVILLVIHYSAQYYVSARWDKHIKSWRSYYHLNFSPKYDVVGWMPLPDNELLTATDHEDKINGEGEELPSHVDLQK